MLNLIGTIFIAILSILLLDKLGAVHCFLFTNSLFKPFIHQTPPGVCPCNAGLSHILHEPPLFCAPFHTSNFTHTYPSITFFTNNFAIKRQPALAPAQRDIPSPQTHDFLPAAGLPRSPNGRATCGNAKQKPSAGEITPAAHAAHIPPPRTDRPTFSSN